MRRLPKSLLRASLSSRLLHRRAPLPLTLLHPLSPHPHHRPCLLPFSTQTLTPGISPDAAPTGKPAGLAFLEEAEAQESAGDHQRVIDLALNALVPLQESHGGWSLPVARALRLAGTGAFRAGRVSDGIESLGAAAEVVDYLWGARRGDREVAVVGAAVYEQLARAKTAAGRRWDAGGDLRRSLEMKAVFLEPGSEELEDAYRDVAEAYAGMLDFDKALPLCLKTMEIAEGIHGKDSTHVAKVWRMLAVVYTGSGRNEEALEQIELARMVYERLGLDVELSQVEIDGANVLVLLGRSEEAMNYLKRVMQRSSKESEERALAYVTMAKILSFQDRSEDSKRCLEIACGIIDAKNSMNLEQVAEAYAEISMLYELMTEFETSLTLMKKTLALLGGASEMQHIAGSISARMGWLLLLTRRIDEAVPYLESAVDKLKNCFGAKHFGLGFAYKHLGQAYLEMDQHQLAVKFLELAKGIIVATFGPTHEDSIDINQSLANAYGLMGSYNLAMDFQEQVVDAYKRSDTSSSEELRESHRLLEQLRKKAQGSPAAVFPANALPLLPENSS